MHEILGTHFLGSGSQGLDEGSRLHRGIGQRPGLGFEGLGHVLHLPGVIVGSLFQLDGTVLQGLVPGGDLVLGLFGDPVDVFGPLADGLAEGFETLLRLAVGIRQILHLLAQGLLGGLHVFQDTGGAVDGLAGMMAQDIADPSQLGGVLLRRNGSFFRPFGEAIPDPLQTGFGIVGR